MSQSVLIIESEPWLGDHYEKSLQRSGYAVTRAMNPYTAIDMIDESQPAAIVMSLLLSGSGGLGLLHELQTYVDTAAIPVVVCSSLPNIKLDDLRPYGVTQLLNSTTMQPDDVAMAVRSVLAA